MATIAAVHDLSGVGRCSLTAAIAVLSAMGHHCCPLPTAVLSSQTGFGGYTYLDLTDWLEDSISKWERLPLRPDIIFTGFLGSPSQPELLARYIRSQPQAVALVDPVMADCGELYPCFDGTYVTHMKHLVKAAAIITPNISEFLLLAGENPAGYERYFDLTDEDAYWTLADRIRTDRLQHIVVTGIAHDAQVCNLVLDLGERSIQRICTPHTDVAYSGTGDLFASVLSGCIANGEEIAVAVTRAAGFISRVAADIPPGSDPRQGMQFEKYLALLTPKIPSSEN